MRAAAALAIALAACGGATGTVQIDLATAPGSTVLDGVQRIRLTVTQPRQVTEAPRTSSGFDLSLDFDANGNGGAVIVEGFDGDGALVACGQSPVFPVSSLNAQIVVYMAPPRSVGFAPATLSSPRSEVAGASIGYGVVLVGGRESSGAPSTAIAVYNSYDHTITPGLALPSARTGLAVAPGVSAIYLFGGTGPGGTPTGTLWRFDTTVAPSGAYFVVSDQASFARTGQLMVPIGADRFLITGMPALVLTSGVLAPVTDVAELPAAGTSVAASDGAATAIFADQQLVRFRQDTFDTVGANTLTAATTAALPNGRIVVVGDGGNAPTTTALVVDAATGAVTAVPDALTTARAHPSLAATARQLIVAGGTDAGGAAIATAEVLDAVTLAHLATLPILPRTGVFAVALATDQVMLVGGTPASAQIELYTPEPPAL